MEFINEYNSISIELTIYYCHSVSVGLYIHLYFAQIKLYIFGNYEDDPLLTHFKIIYDESVVH